MYYSEICRLPETLVSKVVGGASYRCALILC